ncbi:M56 family metallopeptidase [Candidatus Latescibacterota bacterium]
MRELLFIEFILSFSSHAIVIGLGLLVQSTIIIAPCLFAVYALRNKGSALQSLVLRATLVAVLLCPIISLYFHYSGVKIFKVSIPSVSYELSEKPISLSENHNRDIASAVINEPETNTGMNDFISRRQFPNNAIFFDSPGEMIPLLTNVPQRNYTSERDPSIILGEQNVLAESERPPQAPSSKIQIISYLLFTFAWIAFSVFLFCRILLHSFYIKQIRGKARTAKLDHAALCGTLADEFGLKKPTVLQSAVIKSPFLSGIIKPVVFMPQCENDSSFPIKEILLHELSHLQRNDCHWNLLRQIGTLLVPFQPLMWILSNWIEETSDYACDDFVMKYTGNNRSYAKILLNIAQSFHPSGRAATAEVGFLSFKSPLRRRIGRILSSTHILSLRTNARLVLCISFLCFSASVASGFVGFESQNKLNHQKGSLNFVSSMILNSIIDPFPNKTFSPISLPQTDIVKNDEVIDEEIETITAESQDTKESIGDNAPGKLVKQTGKFEISSFANTENMKLFETAVTGYDSRGFPASKTDGSAYKDDGALTERGSYSDETYTGGAKKLSDTMQEQGDEATDQAQIDSEQNIGFSSGQMFTNGGMQISGFEGDVIKMPVAKAVNVTVEVDYENQIFDLKNEEDKRQYSIYHGLDKLKNEPAWSPDGKWIAFTDRNRIWIVSPNGGDPTLVYESFQDGFSIGNFESLCFSHDSREIMFKKDVYDTNKGSEIEIWDSGMFRSATFSNPIPNIESVNIETGEHRVIIEEGYNFCRSFDGRYICFLSWASRTDSLGIISGGKGLPALYDTMTGVTQFLADDGLRYGKPAFGPDEGFVIIPVRDENGPIELHKLFVDGSNSEQLTFFDENDGLCKYQNFPEVSPDGKWILCSDFTLIENSPDSRLILYSAVTGERFEFFDNAKSRNSYGKWSPDGTKICYLVQEKDSNYIYICDFFPENYALKKPALNDAEVPLSFKLNQNFPNPFNSSTTIEFSVPEAGNVSLAIYNSMGQNVAELVSSNTEPGYHSVVWDGRDKNGMSVSSGVYVYRLRMGNKRENRKMTLFK